MQFAVCGAAWWQEFVLPLSYYPYYQVNQGSLLWYVILTINYELEICYFLLMVEGACWIVLPWLTCGCDEGDQNVANCWAKPYRHFWRW
jgi:hypothetical protein